MSRGTRTRREESKPSRRQETLRVTSEIAQAARQRAQKCFLSMIEGPVEPQVFVANARYINPEIYSDVVVERAVAGLCGYPMCGNTFTDTYGSRTYIIRANKVYDISERRNFCSNACYEASELVRKQVLTLPLYLRDTKDTDIKDIRLPDLTKLNGRHGKLVDVTGGMNKMEVNENDKPSRRTAFMSVDDIARESLVNWSEKEAEENAGNKDSQKSDLGGKEAEEGGKDPEKDRNTSGNETKENVDDKDSQKSDLDTDVKAEGGKDTEKDGKEINERDSIEYTKNKDSTNSLGDVLQVESVLRQWVSFDSLRVILGDLYIRGMLEHLGQSWDNYDTTSGLRLSVEAKARYIAICRRLEHDERQEEEEEEGQDKLDQNSKKPTGSSKPLPNYSQLQRDAKAQQLKVVSFLGGNDQYEVEGDKLDTIPEEENCSSTKGKVKLKKQSEDSNTREPTLPFVDSYSQVAWRQNIVGEKITSYLQQMLEMTKLSVQEIQKLLGPLIATFHLAPNNISFHPKQWRLITLILLNLLSVRYQIIKDALRTEEGLSMQRSVLSTYSLDLGYCDRVLSYLTEIQHVLSKDFQNDKTESRESRDTQDQNIHLQSNLGDCEIDKTKESENTTETSRLSQSITKGNMDDNSID